MEIARKNQRENLSNKEKIRAIAEKYNLSLIYVFGSQVSAAKDLLNGVKVKSNDRLTDVDIGVVFQKNLPHQKQRFLVYSYIFNDLQDIFLPFSLDLVFLQETHSVFQAQAICGYCIYYSSRKIKEEYEENILRRAADFKPFLERYLDEILEEV